jgi:hypothetical protein
MSVNRASTIFGIASLKIQRVLLHPWLIIELMPAFLGNTWLCQHQDYVLNTSVKGASMTFGLASWKIQGLRGDIEVSSNCQPPFYAKMITTTSLLGPKNKRQQSINDFWHCILEKARVVQRHWPIIELSAAFLGKNTSDKIVTMSHNERQRRINDFWLCILDNLTAMERR